MKVFSSILLMSLFVVLSAFNVETGDPILDKAEKMPTLKGCENENADEAFKCTYMKIINGLVSNLKYPAAAKKNNTQGTAYIEFVVSKDGKITESKIKKDLKDGCGEAALKAFQTSVGQSSWNAGEDKGKKVSVKMVLPVKFKMEE